MRDVTSRVAVSLGVLSIMLLLSGSSCDPPSPDAAERDSTSSLGSYEQLQRQQPAEQMGYSPARNAINKWVRQWGVPGKLSYVYLYSDSGTPLGYYILEGLPVSYCTTQTRPVEPDRNDGYGSLLVPLPGIDGTFSSGSACDQYFGVEANTGTILEFGGGGISYLLAERPLPVPHEPLGVTIEQAPPPQ